MERYQFSYSRLTRSSLIGALIALVFDFVVTFLTSSQDVFALKRIPAYVAFLLVGFAGGWLFELFRIQTDVTAESGRTLTELQASVESLTRKITYQDQRGHPAQPGYWRHTGDVETYWMTSVSSAAPSQG